MVLVKVNVSCSLAVPTRKKKQRYPSNIHSRAFYWQVNVNACTLSGHEFILELTVAKPHHSPTTIKAFEQLHLSSSAFPPTPALLLF